LFWLKVRLLAVALKTVTYKLLQFVSESTAQIFMVAVPGLFPKRDTKSLVPLMLAEIEEELELDATK
jgi:hypothetical protein